MDLIFFVLVCYGLTQIIVDGKILEPVRPKYMLFHCSMCMGFWVGMALAFLSDYTNLWNFQKLDIFLMGTLGSGTTFFLTMLVKKIKVCV